MDLDIFHYRYERENGMERGPSEGLRERKPPAVMQDAGSDSVGENLEEEAPELTFKNVMMDLIRMPLLLALSPLNFELVAIPLWILESLALKYIVANVAYTEIDYSTYMQQVSQFWAGERDYANIGGDTGPLVYPAGHLWVYTALQWVSGTERGGVKEKKSMAQVLAGNAFYGAKALAKTAVATSTETVKTAVHDSLDALERAADPAVIEGMQNVQGAQHVFRWVYLATFTTVVFGYWLLNERVGWRGTGLSFVDNDVRREGNGRLWGFSPYLLVLLATSKRLHSIYVLRMFNDCFVTLFMAVSWVLLLTAVNVKRDAFQRVNAPVAAGGENGHGPDTSAPTLEEHTTASTVILYGLLFASVALYSLALSVKMSALLYFPGYALVVYLLCSESAFQLAMVLFVGLEVQLALNWPFVSHSSALTRNFLARAFDFGRVFQYKWTVNWKFVSEDIFLSRGFHTSLFVLHVATLAVLGLWVFLAPRFMGKSVKRFVSDAVLRPFQETLSPTNIILSERGEVYVTYVLFSCNLVGILFSRSLHYQFLAWYHWTLPFFYQASGLPWYAVVVLAAAHEWCWCVFPATPLSSGVLVCVLSILFLLSTKTRALL